MNDSVNPPGPGVKGPRRAYNGSGRRARALQTRRAVIAAAGALLVERGYAATTIAEVARVAGVSPESIYKGFGTKPALLKAVLDVALAGDDDPVPVAERPEARQIAAQPDGPGKLRLYAAQAATRAGHSARIQLALRNAAPADPAVAELWATVQQERLTGMTMLARHLAGSGVLRPGVGIEEARDVLWTGISVEVYDLLVFQRGWSQAAYADWLARTLIAALT